MIDNPTYKGPWAPRKVPNPEYYDEKHPGHMTPIGAIGLELWTMQDQIMFDNILISDSVTAEQLEAWTKDTWTKKHDVELAVIKAEEPETDVTDADKDAGAALSLAEQFAPANLQKFVDTLVVDPKKALDKYPAPLAAIALFVTMLVAALGSFVFGGSSAAKPAVATKKAARSASPKKKSDDEEEEKKPAAAKASGSKKSADGESARKRAKAAEKEASVADAEDDDE
ncbi:Calreticulin family-domain-containing protein [Blastocladiella britannica]|nr:Calreticulin family-domain-containing protein [Blastocladiella britannica]